MKNYTCLAVDDSELQLVILRNYIQKTPYLQLHSTFNDPKKAYHFLSENKVDILFLDIDMPELSGLELLKQLPYVPSTVLITSKTEFALEAYNLEVVDYIVKPPEYQRFLKAVDKAISRTKQHAIEESQDIFIKFDGKLLRLETSKIDYIEALRDYIIIHTEDKRQYIVYSSMKKFEQTIHKFSDIIRIHRSYFVNITKVNSFDNNGVLINKKLLSVSSTYKKEFLKKLKEH